MKSTYYEFSLKKLSLPGAIELTYIDEGEGNNVLFFIHGLGSYLSVWRKNISVLRNKYRCIAIDLPGYGLSPKMPGKVSMLRYASVIINSILVLNLKQPILVGHSMGGHIALVVAIHYAHLIKKLVLASPAGLEPFSNSSKTLILNTLKPDVIQKLSNYQIKQNVNFAFYKFLPEAEFMIQERIAKKSLPNFQQYCSTVSESTAAMLEYPVFDQLSNILQPTLIVFGEEDALIPNKLLKPASSTREIAKKGASRIPNSKLILLKECGHFLPFEKSDAFNKAVDRFAIS